MFRYVFVVWLVENVYLNAEQNMTVFVSKDGKNEINCGTESSPCQNLEIAIDRLNDGGTVIISAQYNMQTFAIKNSIKINNKSIKIKGGKNMPLIVIQKNVSFAFRLQVKNGTGGLSLQHLAIKNKGMNKSSCKERRYGIIKSENTEIKITNCFIYDVCTVVEFIPSRMIEKATTSISSTEFTNVCFILKAEYISNIDLEVVESKLTGCHNRHNNLIVSHAFVIKCYEQLKVFVQDSVLNHFDEGISITVKSQYQITVQKSLFTLNSGQSIIITYTERSVAASTTLISDVQFVKNGGVFSSCIHIVSKQKQRNFVQITKCTFYDNFSETFFGAVYADGVSVKIDHSDFLNNLAGEYHGTIQGFGGAIYVETDTKVIVEMTNFINNTASGFGGTVFSRGTFACVNCSFTGASKVRIRPLLGDIIYATAGLQLANTSWKSTIYNEGPKSLIWHPGSPTLEVWKILITGVFEATCPVGHNISYSGIERYDRALTKRVIMSCKSCPKNQYSLTSGAIFLYQNEGSVLEKNIEYAQCHNCKYGAICQRGSIKPQANYYGFKQHSNDHELKFIPCPIGYCCVGDSCQRYDSCHSKRTGLLCGKCKNGTSENLINSNCADASECKHHWFWVIYIPIGICYILGFMYLDKISTFVSNQIMWWNKKIHHPRDDLDEYEVVDYGMFSSRDPFSQEASREESDDEIIKTSSHRRPLFTYSTYNNISDGNQSEQPDIIEETEQNSDHPANKRIFHAHVKERGPDAFTDLLTISFYFYQMFLLIRMQESMVIEHTMKCLRSIYSSIFTLSLEGNSPFVVCPFVGLTPITKLLLVKSFACYILILLLVFHSIVYVVQFLYLQDLRRKQSIIIFSVRLKVATVQILLVSYATLSTTAVTLVNCITMYDHKVLFIDGTIQCYKWWQTAVFALVLAWVMPFPFVMVASLVHLKKQIITYHQFVLAWAFPLFYLILVLSNYLQKIFWKTEHRERKSRSVDQLSEYSSVTEEKLSIDEILFRMECPYKGDKNHLNDRIDLDLDGSNYFEPAVWQGVLIGRRLLLILILTFIKAPVLRLYCALFVCLLYLVQHIYYRPFIIGFTNIYETTTSVILVMFCSMNLFFAYSYVSDLPPEMADENLTAVFRWTEATILVILPSLAGIVLACLVFSRLCILFFRTCKYGVTGIRNICFNLFT